MVVALAVAVAVDAAGASRALAAGTGREPLHGHQGIVPPGATLIGPAPSTTTLPLVVTLQPRDPATLERRGPGGLRPALAPVPPFPDAGRVRAAVRCDAVLRGAGRLRAAGARG